MNQALQARPCWSLLAQRAEDQLELIRLEMTQANHRLNQLEHSRQRLNVMYEDYSQQFNQPGSQSRGTASVTAASGRDKRVNPAVAPRPQHPTPKRDCAKPQAGSD